MPRQHAARPSTSSSCSGPKSSTASPNSGWAGAVQAATCLRCTSSTTRPRARINELTHVAADRPDLTVVHVTHFNDLFWDCGTTPTTVIEHGIPEPPVRWSGELPRIAVVTNEPVRRARITGTDLIGRFTDLAPVDVFGMGLDGLARSIGLHQNEAAAIGDLRHEELLANVARRRVYVHLTRWTSLGLSLLEAMVMGCPV